MKKSAKDLLRIKKNIATKGYFHYSNRRKEYSELHLKTGNLRFHFLPENGRIYFRYFGKHLDTYKFI